MEVEIFTICHSVVNTEREFSIKHIFNNACVDHLPISHSFLVIARIRYYKGEFGEHDFQLLFGSPSGEIIPPNIHHKYNVLPPEDFDFPIDFTLDTIMTPIDRIIFTQYGTYYCAILVDGKQIGTRPFIVSPVPVGAR